MSQTCKHDTTLLGPPHATRTRIQCRHTELLEKLGGWQMMECGVESRNVTS
jgi:hypothetical protein